jgi:microcystin-dependent protein
MDPMLGMIVLWGGARIPYGWASCQGQLLPIQQNAALFSLIGIQYGGDGKTNFALPNLQGRVPLGSGTSPDDGKVFKNAAVGGTRKCVLNQTNLPMHSHTATFTPSGSVSVSTALAATQNPGSEAKPTAGLQLAEAVDVGGMGGMPLVYAPAGGTQVPLAGVSSAISGNFAGNVSVGNTGANAPFDPSSPYTVLQYIIATSGLYPELN